MSRSADTVGARGVLSSTPRPSSTAVAGPTTLTTPLRPSLPELPPWLASALRSGRRVVISEAAFAGLALVPGWVPPPLANDERQAVAALADAYDAALAPGAPERIAARIAGLLAHWRGRDGLSDGEQTMLAADWMAVIGEYPEWAVHEAAADWLRFNRYRPTIAEMRLLCDDAIRADRTTLALLRRVAAESSMR